MSRRKRGWSQKQPRAFNLTDEQQRIIRERFATTRTEELAVLLGLNYFKVLRAAHQMGLVKASDFSKAMSAIAKEKHGKIYQRRVSDYKAGSIEAEKYDLPQKLYNFDLEDYKRVNAVMYSQDYRDGWVEVWLVEYMCCLDLPLKYKWFDMIDRGEKPEEYRDKKWLKRLRSHEYTHIRFRRGCTGRTAIFRYDGFRFGTPKPGWCEPEDEGEELLVIKIGERYK